MQILSFREVYKGFFHGRHKYVLRRVNFKRIEENLNQKKKMLKGSYNCIMIQLLIHSLMLSVPCSFPDS